MIDVSETDCKHVPLCNLPVCVPGSCAILPCVGIPLLLLDPDFQVQLRQVVFLPVDT